MGAKWVFVWKPNNATVDNNKIFDEICYCMRALDALWEAELRSYFAFVKPIISDQSQTAVDQSYAAAISLVEEPDKYYFILREDRIVDETHMSLNVLQGYAFQVSQYRSGNFQWRVGKVIENSSWDLKTVFMEVDFLDMFTIEDTRYLMKLQINMWNLKASRGSWHGQFVQVDFKYAEYNLSDNYTPQHTVLQYYGVMASLKLGTKWIFVWEPDVGTAVDYNGLFKKICGYAESAFNAVRGGSWGSYLTVIEPIVSGQSQAAYHQFDIALAEEQNKRYLVQPNQNRVLEVDVRMIEFFNEPTFEFWGSYYEQDELQLQLRVGRVSDIRTGIFRAFCVEVVYINDFSIQRTRNLMEEHFNMFNEAASEGLWMGRFVQIDRRYAEFGLSNADYTPQHTSLQYFAIMAHLLTVQLRRQDRRRPFSLFVRQFDI